jgi:hypothetical protein
VATEDHPDVVEDAIKYIIFLSEVDKLYDVALGMYDFQLVLMIAQYSQKVGRLPNSSTQLSDIIIGPERIPSLLAGATGFGSFRAEIPY